MASEFPYTSIYDYLDNVLSAVDLPTALQIKNAKREYWKLWYKAYRKTKRRELKEFTLRLDQKKLKRIDIKRGKYSRSQYLYYAVDLALDNNQLEAFDRALFGRVYQTNMRLINLLEDIESGDNPHALQDAYNAVMELEKELSKFK
ncbi:hypothetical protein [Lacinutrix chionoecetis]